MQIPVIKKLSETYSLAQLKEAEEAILNESIPTIEIEGKDDEESN
jgi:hypothetical protein